MTRIGDAGCGRRIVFDVSSLLRWVGPPVGIIRREHALARHALAKRPDILLSFFDKTTGSFLTIDREWIERLTGWDHALDMATPAVRQSRRGLAKLKPSRHLLMMALERRRLTTPRPVIRRAIGLVQRMIWLPHRLPEAFTDKGGARAGLVPSDLALGAPIKLTPDDVLLSVGDDWFHKEAGAIADLKQGFGFRCVVMCHDLIPVMFPAFFPERIATLFRRHWCAMFPIADRILVNSRRVGADIREFCGAAEMGAGEIVLVQPGCNIARPDPTFTLPAGLEPGKFALYVGTIEPRKGHAMLIEVWRHLLTQGIPQRHGFKLVFAGRPGWNVDEVLHQIADASSFQGTLLHLSAVDDSILSGLYRDAAFCLFPSAYEGFGVPIVEAFAHGKAVIASTGGALPETVGSFSPCLPAGDRRAWLAAIQQWIENENARVPYEERIRESFSHPDWELAAARIFDAAVREA